MDEPGFGPLMGAYGRWSIELGASGVVALANESRTTVLCQARVSRRLCVAYAMESAGLSLVGDQQPGTRAVTPQSAGSTPAAFTTSRQPTAQSSQSAGAFNWSQAMTAKKAGPVLAAFNQAVLDNRNLEPVDDAVIELGRSIAKAIDDITADPEASATDKTKALYLTPHLVGILKELLATPLARKSVGLAATETKKASRLTLIKDSTKNTG